MSETSEKELFYFGHTGSNYPYCLSVLTLVSTCVVLLRLSHSSSISSEVLLVVAPLFLALTCCSELVYHGLALTILAIVAGVYFRGSSSSSISRTLFDDLPHTHPHEKEKAAFLTDYKGGVMLMTCMAILMVDFAVFPRSNAKTEEFGLSVMDVGVGAFIVSSGLTSSFARRRQGQGQGQSQRHKARGSSLWTGQFFRLAAVLALGVGRTVVLRALAYHEHSSEYGNEWNFFVTLGAVWMTANTLHTIASQRATPVIATAILVYYQWKLQADSDLTAYVFDSPRDEMSFVSSNREGIISLLGFLPMFLLSESFAREFIFLEPDDAPPSSSSLSFGGGGGGNDDANSPNASSVSSSERGLRVARPEMLEGPLLAVFVGGLALYSASTTYQEPSRRLGNLPYVLAVLSMSACVLWVLVVGERVIGPGPGSAVGGGSSSLLKAFSKYQLPIFVLANLLTGAVNMAMDTIHASDATALLLLAVYTLVLVAVATLSSQLERGEKAKN